MNWLLLFPAATALAVLVMASHLVVIHIRRQRCPHNTVRLIRQQRGESIYFARVCMGCCSTFGERK